VLTLRLCRRIREVPRSAWDELALPDPSPFVEWTWLDALEEAGCVGEGTGWTPLHFTLWRGDDLVGAAPAYVKENSEGEFVYDWSWADLAHRLGTYYYPKLVFAVPFTPATGGRALVAPGESRVEIVAALAEGAHALVDRAGLAGVHVLFPTESERNEWTAQEGFFPRAHAQYHWHNRGYGTFDDFLARFRSKRRNQLKREVAQPAKDGVVIETVPRDALDPALARTMHSLYLSTVDKFVYGRRYLNSRFFEILFERYAERLACVVARSPEREIIAGAFNVKKGPMLYGRYWGTRVDMPFLHFNVCYYHGIKDAIALGVQTFEPGAGGEHKLVRGFDPTLTHSAHFVRHPRLAAILSAFTERERKEVCAAIARHSEDSPQNPA
jgi:predicted N-acyltransferase